MTAERSTRAMAERNTTVFMCAAATGKSGMSSDLRESMTMARSSAGNQLTYLPAAFYPTFNWIADGLVSGSRSAKPGESVLILYGSAVRPESVARRAVLAMPSARDFGIRAGKLDPRAVRARSDRRTRSSGRSAIQQDSRGAA
jgi:hypothetical protein